MILHSIMLFVSFVMVMVLTSLMGYTVVVLHGSFIVAFYVSKNDFVLMVPGIGFGKDENSASIITAPGVLFGFVFCKFLINVRFMFFGRDITFGTDILMDWIFGEVGFIPKTLEPSEEVITADGVFIVQKANIVAKRKRAWWTTGSELGYMIIKWPYTETIGRLNRTSYVLAKTADQAVVRVVANREPLLQKVNEMAQVYANES